MTCLNCVAKFQSLGKGQYGWNEMVIKAISAHYNLDKAMMTLPKKGEPVKKPEKKQSPTKKKKDNKTVSKRSNRKINNTLEG
jgi:hypothetical protein